MSENDLLGRLNRQSHRDRLAGLQASLIELAACAASGNACATDQYIDILGTIPDERDQLREAIVLSMHRLMEKPDGLNAVLPALYTAMVGASVRVRAAAATGLGKLNRRGREDVPELLYEAFATLLSDPYVMVHGTAVKTLEHLELPAELDLRAKSAVLGWINSYATSRSDDRFLVRSIKLYLRKYTPDQPTRTGVGRVFVALLEKMKPDIVAADIGSLRHDLSEAEGFAALVVRLLSRCWTCATSTGRHPPRSQRSSRQRNSDAQVQRLKLSLLPRMSIGIFLQNWLKLSPDLARGKKRLELTKRFMRQFQIQRKSARKS